jgi:D-serine deaminase-like pyridoxal phosphate-dependent protein
MTSRREFLAAGAAATLAARPRTGRVPNGAFPYAELESRIARRDFRGVTKDVLPTPCMVIDKSIFDANVKKMADHCAATGIKVRPHVKVHKSVDVARRQLALGAIGVTTATLAEAELMSRAGIEQVLWTKQPASANNVGRAVALSKRDPTFMFVVDDPLVVDWVEAAAAAEGARCRIVVDVYAGMKRHGMEAGKPAIELAQKIAASKRLRLEGCMGYSGTASHTHGFEDRSRRSAEDLSGLRETVELWRKAGLPLGIVSGGSTGTYNIDRKNGLTELQAGSYVFMDTNYFVIGAADGSTDHFDFGGSLTVLTAVGSKRHPGQATTDYGRKALAQPTDRVKGMPWLEVGMQGAEYGLLKWDAGHPELKLGDRVEIYPTNLDMSTNVYDRYYVAQGDQIVDVWPIMGRSGAAQR